MKYIIVDNERGYFGEWTHQSPLTRREIIEHFKEMSDRDDLQGGCDELIPLKDFSLRMISKVWNVEILPVKA